MRILYKVISASSAIICLLVVAGLFSEVFAQIGLPAAPRQIPWENIILSLMGCLGYGAVRIILKKDK